VFIGSPPIQYPRRYRGNLRSRYPRYQDKPEKTLIGIHGIFTISCLRNKLYLAPPDSVTVTPRRIHTVLWSWSLIQGFIKIIFAILTEN